jgi:hypothetical protein
MPWAITWYVVLVFEVLVVLVADASLLSGELSLAPSAAASLAVRLTFNTDGSLKKSSSTGSLLEDRPVLRRSWISFLYMALKYVLLEFAWIELEESYGEDCRR